MGEKLVGAELQAELVERKYWTDMSDMKSKGEIRLA